MSYHAEHDQPASPYPPAYFQRPDQSNDALFYDFPRKVVHLDDGAIATLGAVYAELLPPAGTLLDLMSSWRTHLPPALAASPGLEVVGLGMNAEEMADNPRLSRHVVHDLNRRRLCSTERRTAVVGHPAAWADQCPQGLKSVNSASARFAGCAGRACKRR